MPPNTLEQDAATELLILQLIAADFNAPFLGPLPTPSNPHVEHLPTGHSSPFHLAPLDGPTADFSRDNVARVPFASDPAAESGNQGQGLEQDTERASPGSCGDWAPFTGSDTPPIETEGGESSSRREEAVWWAEEGKGNARRPAEDGADEDEGEGDGQTDGWADEGEDEEEGWGDEEENEGDHEEDGSEEEDEGEEEEMEKGTGVIFIPLPGERRWHRHRRMTSVDVVEVAEVHVDEDETLEGILAAMIL